MYRITWSQVDGNKMGYSSSPHTQQSRRTYSKHQKRITDCTYLKNAWSTLNGRDRATNIFVACTSGEECLALRTTQKRDQRRWALLLLYCCCWLLLLCYSPMTLHALCSQNPRLWLFNVSHLNITFPIAKLLYTYLYWNLYKKKPLWRFDDVDEKRIACWAHQQQRRV